MGAAAIEERERLPAHKSLHPSGKLGRAQRARGDDNPTLGDGGHLLVHNLDERLSRDALLHRAREGFAVDRKRSTCRDGSLLRARDERAAPCAGAPP